MSCAPVAAQVSEIVLENETALAVAHFQRILVAELVRLAGCIWVTAKAGSLSTGTSTLQPQG